ncbi:MAG: preprotein translocase subunit SecE [Firmicutes bacterium ML8_F2]|jgi:preprotein translocase subunit SecE|nr:MAG: preprotein translocase subunit SecE [Firmicutes bacterium ML8_F2]
MRFFKRISKFLQEVKVELKKVNWPTKREFSVFTGIVISTVLIIGLFFWGLDSLFLSILQLVIR